MARAEAVKAEIAGAAADLNHAIATTRASVEADLESGCVHGALCHGGMSNAEILGLVSAPDDESIRRLRRDAASSITDRVARGMPWPTDYAGKPQPTLMQGLAGIGMCFLRLEHPDIPSPLAP